MAALLHPVGLISHHPPESIIAAQSVSLGLMRVCSTVRIYSALNASHFHNRDQVPVACFVLPLKRFIENELPVLTKKHRSILTAIKLDFYIAKLPNSKY